mgnify:CR=1 FL=1
MSDWLTSAVAALHPEAEMAAREHQNQLTKPAGSLGQLEGLAIRLAAMQDTPHPEINRVAIRIFAADHGVVAEGVSAFPQAVTVEMIRNFAQGGAAVSVLAQELNADFAVVNMGTAAAAPEPPKVLDYRVGPGTGNFCRQPAMTEPQVHQALNAGKQVAEACRAAGAELFIAGEMGIGNTSSAAALGCALLQLPAEQLAGRGTGVDDSGLSRKIEAVNRALELHQGQLGSPLQILRHLGGFEIAAMTGAYLRCAQLGMPALVDGFICSAAALVAVRINPQAAQWLIFSHQSAEQGHQRLLEALAVTPLLALDMRLGEGSGAAVAVPLIRLACRLHNRMATFATAGVSDKAP